MIWSTVASFQHRVKCLYDCWLDSDDVLYFVDPSHLITALVDSVLYQRYYGRLVDSFVESLVANTKTLCAPVLLLFVFASNREIGRNGKRLFIGIKFGADSLINEFLTKMDPFKCEEENLSTLMESY